MLPKHPSALLGVLPRLHRAHTRNGVVERDHVNLHALKAVEERPTTLRDRRLRETAAVANDQA